MKKILLYLIYQDKDTLPHQDLFLSRNVDFLTDDHFDSNEIFPLSVQQNGTHFKKSSTALRSHAKAGDSTN